MTIGLEGADFGGNSKPSNQVVDVARLPEFVEHPLSDGLPQAQESLLNLLVDMVPTLIPNTRTVSELIQATAFTC